jgi:hypothetical protein
MSYESTGADLAEWYETEPDVTPGDIVAVSSDSYQYDSELGLQQSSILAKATEGSTMVGVVSSAPYQTMGTDIFSTAQHPEPIALAGRVPVLVTDENGKIKAGDLLTVSSTPGVAMKATKAGFTIGTALEDSNCVGDTPCKVLVMVNSTYSNGSMLKDMLQQDGLTLDAIPQGVDIGRMVLAQELQDKQNILDDTNAISEVDTDVLTAGLEVITPQVVTDEVDLNTIKSATGSAITMQLNDNGEFVINDSSGSAKVRFDDNGNAYFSGNVYAAGFNLNQTDGLSGIEAGLKILSSGMTDQEARINNLESLFATASAVPNTGTKVAGNAATPTIAAVLGISESATVSGDLRVEGNGLIEGILHVADTLFANNFLVNGVSDFFGNVIFHSNVAFDNAPVFDSNTAGIAIVTKGTDQVTVTFSQPYTQTPMVSANITLNPVTPTPGETASQTQQRELARESDILNNTHYIIVNRTVNGFTIILDKPADENIRFSWFAFTVQNPAIFQSSVTSSQMPSLPTAVDLTPNPTDTPTETLAPTQEATASAGP